MGEKYSGDTLIESTVGGNPGTINVNLTKDSKVKGILFLSNGMHSMREIRQFRDAIDEEYGTILMERWTDFGEISWVDNMDDYATYIVIADWAPVQSRYFMGFLIMRSKDVGKVDPDKEELKDF